MRVDVEVNYAFKEELVGDEKDSKNFYLRLTPIVNIRPKHEARPTKADRDALVKAVMAEIKKKGPIK